ncbi:MAG: 3'(2'),5'-bisphosphate nucleotidase CysQ [Candidatus Cloacimonadota bacterium]|nr:MAG: 3'(2'),5'-bisphosphate nucleotidase CysQ [Candidatus Cloacimonadota bacterium]PCJ20126.1 MAG: 3'(2'),5'-bisphosphate nucleotidase CysQ [Candidatus Cloacimonadota bacterium]
MIQLDIDKKANFMKLPVDKFLEVIARAGTEIMKLSMKEDLKVTDKGGNDPLSEADLLANDILSELKDLVPGSWFFSEENEDDLIRLEKEYVWIVDPIDGTREFVKQIPEYAISVSLVRREKSLFSAVYNPNDSLEYQFNGTRGTLNKVEYDRVYKPTVCVSRSEWNKDFFKNLESELDLEVIGSIAYKLSLVAQKRHLGVISLCPKNEWDIAGGVALIEAAGMVACDLYGRKFHFNRSDLAFGIIAGEEDWVKEVLTKIDLSKHFAKH